MQLNPSITHRDYVRYQERWRKLQACLDGEEAVKAAGELYLPYPVRIDDVDKESEEYAALYELFLEGAHFVEYTSEAVEDLISSAFRRPVKIEPPLPEVLNYLDIQDIAKEMVWYVGGYGRLFWLVDYPTIETTPSMRDDVNNRAYISLYAPLSVLDWTVSKRSGKAELVRVVLVEIDEVASTSDSIKYMYREILVNDLDIVEIRIHKEDEERPVVLLPKASGQFLRKIPGGFCGTTSNTAKVDKSPVIGIANSNLKHYATWADLSFVQTYVGHPQTVLTGLPAGWNKAYIENQKALAAARGEVPDVKIRLDAANILGIEGENSDAKLLQLNTDSLVHFRTLETLEASMLEQGARIKAISKKAGVESAEALKIRSSGSMSKLAAIVLNVSEALTEAVSHIAAYMGTTSDSVIKINTEFFTPEPDGSLVTAITAAEASKTAPRGTAIRYLQQIELVDEDADIEELISKLGELTSSDSNSQGTSVQN